MNSQLAAYGVIIMLGIALSTIRALSQKRTARSKRANATPRARNLYAINNSVVVRESLERDDMDWNGIVIGRKSGNVVVRDTNAPYAIVEVHPSWVFPDPNTAEGMIWQERTNGYMH